MIANFTFIYHHHHHHIALVARISLTLSRHSSLSFTALGRSSGQHPVSSHSCWMYVRAGRPAFARPCVGVHKSTSLMSSSLLLQQCPACLVRLIWIVFVIGGRRPLYIYIYPKQHQSLQTAQIPYAPSLARFLSLSLSVPIRHHSWQVDVTQCPQRVANCMLFGVSKCGSPSEKVARRYLPNFPSNFQDLFVILCEMGVK